MGQFGFFDADKRLAVISAKGDLIEKLFERFGQHLEAKGYIARGGQMVDATIVPVPKQRNSRDENDDVKAGKTPGAWKKDPSKNRQKDKDARWTKKHGKSFYGYKNHVTSYPLSDTSRERRPQAWPLAAPS